MEERKYKIIEIEWEDITFFNRECRFKEDIDKPQIQKQKTTGYLIKEDKKYLIISATIGKKDFQEFYIFPKGVITKRRTLR